MKNPNCAFFARGDDPSFKVSNFKTGELIRGQRWRSKTNIVIFCELGRVWHFSPHKKCPSA